MSPEGRFQAVVVASTVTVMFGVVVFVQPFIQPLSSAVKGAGFVVGMLASAGTYRTLSDLLALVLRKWRWLREKVLGDAYLEGTWVGFFTEPSGDVYPFYEHFRQTHTTLSIQGFSFHINNSPHADWASQSIDFNSANQRLMYSYTCKLIDLNVTHEGIGDFSILRSSPNAPASSYRGYSADLIDGKRSPSRAKKVSSTFLDESAALQGAREFAASEGVLQ